MSDFLQLNAGQGNKSSAIKSFSDSSMNKLAYLDASSYSMERKKNYGSSQPIPSTAVYQQSDRMRVVGDLRRIYYNNPLVYALINQMAILVGSPTYKYSNGSTIENDIYERMMESALKDIVYQKDWNDIQMSNVLLQEYFITGEVFLVNVDEDGHPAIQIIESELVGSPNKESDYEKNEVDGIIYSNAGKPLRYRVGKFTKNGISYEPKDSTFVDAQYVTHFFLPSRVSQLRGIPPLVSVKNTIIDLEETIQARVSAIKAQSSFIMSVTKNDPTNWVETVNEQANRGQAWYDTAVNAMFNSAFGRSEAVMNVQSGQAVALAPNEKLDFLTPKIDAGFDEFCKMLVVRICGALSLPVSYIIGFSVYSYSSSRSEMLKFQSNIKSLRNSLGHFYQTLSDFVLSYDNIESQEVKLTWEPIKDIDNESSMNVKLKQLQSGQASLGMVGNEYGISPDQVLKERVDEAAMLYDNLKAESEKRGISVEVLRSLMADTMSTTAAQTINAVQKDNNTSNIN